MTNSNSRYMVVAGLLLAFAMVLAACGGGGNGVEPTPRPTERPDRAEDVVNTLPPPPEAEEVGEEALSGAKDSYQETWNNYLRDAIAEQNKDRAQKLSLLQRYENPRITEQNLGGLLESISLIEDRTAFNLTNNATSAGAVTDFDVRLTFLNGDSDTRTCRFNVGLEVEPDDGLWYVLNPAPLQVFASCTP